MSSMRQLTGGTRDVNPQYMHLNGIPDAAGTNQSFNFPVPTFRVGQASGGRATVMEVLKVFVQVPAEPVINNVAETGVSYNVFISTRDHGADNIDYSTPDVFSQISLRRTGAFTAGGTYSKTNDRIFIQDLTDGAGHGILVATEQVYVQLTGTASWATSFRIRLFYRLKNVSLTEYIGIVQSQQ